MFFKSSKIAALVTKVEVANSQPATHMSTIGLADPIQRQTITKVPKTNCPRWIYLSFPDKAFMMKQEFTYTSEIYEFIQARLDVHMSEKPKLCSFMRKPKFYVTYQQKPLSHKKIALTEYNIKHRDVLYVHTDFLLGGSQSEYTYPPLYTHVREAEQCVLQELSVQSVDEYIPKMIYDGVMSKFFETEGLSFVGKLLEDVGILIYHITRARNNADYTIAMINFIKLRSNGPLFSSSNLHALTEKFHSLFDELEVQSSEDVFSTVRGYLDQYEAIREAPLFKKLYKFGMYALSLSLFEKVGITFDTFKYSKIEQEALKRQYHMGPDFIHALLDTITFLCERGVQCMKTGQLDPLYHSGSNYESWFNSARDLELKAQCLAFPEAHGFDRFSFLADLRDTIDKGQAISKHAANLGNYEKRLVASTLHKLQMILLNETTKREAMKERKAPFSILLYGGSSIGKSTLTKMLFYQYGKVHNLPTSSEYCYTRNPVDQFWSGFNSTQWCVVMDDMAFRHPGKASEGDSSVMEMIQVVNNVPFIPTQADLADKGRTPMRARLVIGSTNCEDLNAFHYYQTPLAARRRMPYILDVVPKPEFTKDGCMLDSQKAKESQIDGEWPNYWIYTVKRVVPAGQNRMRQGAATEEVAVFTETDDFLAWFAKQSRIHEDIQEIVNHSDNDMSQIQICNSCFYNQDKCKCELNIQSTDLTNSKPSWGDYIRYYLLMIILWHVNRSWFLKLCQLALRTNFVRETLERKVVSEEAKLQVLRAQFRDMGERVESNIGKYSTLIKVTKSIAKYYAIYKVSSMVYGYFNKSPEVVVTQHNNETETYKSSSYGKMPTAQDEKPNPWKKDDFELTSFDVSPMSVSYKALELNQIKNILSRNMVHFRSFRNVDGNRVSRVIRATAISSHIYMCNNHGLPEDSDILEVEMVSQPKDMGVSSNMTITIGQSDIIRYPAKDLAFVRIRNIPPRKCISELFSKTPIQGNFSGVYLGRCEDGSIFEREIKAIVPQKNYKIEGGVLTSKFTGLAYQGRVYTPTQRGDCGSLMIVKTGLGPVIVGYHMAGGNDVVLSSGITRDDIDQALIRFDEPHIQSGEPLLSAPSAQRNLNDLSQRAPIRWFADGSANVYGSFDGHRANHRSNVQETYIAESMKKRGVIVKHGAPVMKGWEPWHIALNDMIHPVVKLDNNVLNDCVESYYADIISGLSQSDWDDIMVYDDVTTLNGAPGVAFVDKINRSTSAGNPWKKTKKNFLRPIPALEGLSEPVEFTEEIMDRVQIVIDNYHDGKRYMPNFCGHLKDEATKFAKIEKKKTRVFTGAPADWSFVVRKYLLSVIRVMQNNRFVFEGAPGTNAASREWENIRTYLVQFGEDRMVAGDYAAFDKSMPSTIILAAFDIIRRLCKQAGYSESDLKVVQGIAEDTAFPLVDLNGDLIEFYGSNPSGHPLTVIVNGLANALYMRYCYAKLSPEGNAKKFKKHVALMTYGDDNIMGVSKAAPFFNHSTIQRVLADAGITYTMADKETESIPYITLSDCSFLKRTWRWDKDVKAYLAPLEEDSILKSLTIGVASKTLSPEAQSVAIISSAICEYFFYGKETFEEKRKLFEEIIAENKLEFYVTDTTLPLWDELNDRFQSAVPRA